MLGITVSANYQNFEFRLLSCSVWNHAPETATIMAGIELAVYDPITNTSFTDPNVLYSGTDYPGRNTFAKLGYVYPKSVQQHVLRGRTPADRDRPIIYVASTDVSAEVHINIRMDFLWRPANFIDLGAVKKIEPISYAQEEP